MRRTLATAAAVVALSASVAPAQQTISNVDFDANPPVFSFPFAFAGAGGGAGGFQNLNDRVSATLDGAGVLTLDTSGAAGQVPADAAFTFVGAGAGFGDDVDFVPASGDLSAFTISFDAALLGGASGVDLRVELIDADGGRVADLRRIDADRLTVSGTSTSFSFGLDELTVGELGERFAADFADVTQTLVTFTVQSNFDQTGFDADNVLTVDNIRITGPGSAIPEPAAASVLVVAGLAALGRRRR